jgi:hypothetical protein
LSEISSLLLLNALKEVPSDITLPDTTNFK